MVMTQSFIRRALALAVMAHPVAAMAQTTGGEAAPTAQQAPVEQQPAVPAPAAEQAPAQPAPAGQPAPPAPGEIVVQGSAYAKKDPLKHVNEASYAAIQTGDRLVVEPATKLYTKGVPSPLRRGLHNVIYNLREPTNFAAFLMEHKFGKAGETLARFTINSTVGIAGLLDVARSKPIHLPYRPNGLGDVAGFYGIGSGPYFFLPLVGPTTLRDVIGTTIDRSWFAFVVGAPLDTVGFAAGVTVIGGMDDRNAIDGRLQAFRENSSNPYRATRDFYLKRRQEEIDTLRNAGKPKS